MAEVAGLVLGVLPLLLTAAENYKRCFRPLTTYRSFSKHADRFECKLEIQRTIFENQCQLLLEEVTGHDVAAEMLLNRCHNKWTDQQLDSQLDEQLHSSRHACNTILGEINDVLQRLEKWSDTVQSAIESENQALTAGSKPWRSLIKKKVKYSLSESVLKDSLSELKELNDSFLTLTSQTKKLKDRKSAHAHDLQSATTGLREFLAIQDASSSIYEALKNSCSKHTAHRSRLRLSAKIIANSPGSSIEFKVSFDRAAPESSVPSGSSFFIVESALSNHSRWSSTDDVLGQKRTAKSLFEGCSTKRVKLLVKRKETSSGGNANNAERATKSINIRIVDPEGSIPAARETHQRNLGANGNFCTQIKTHLHQQKGFATSSIGVLKEPGGHKHLIRGLPEVNAGNNLALTLESIVRQSSSRSSSNQLSRLNRLTVARSLATAVLQFVGTPWLNLDQPWTSRDVFFFDMRGMGALEKSASLSEPYIDVAVQDAREKEKRAFHAGDLAASPILYNIAIILIELAFGESFEELLKGDLAKHSRLLEVSEFLAARRFADLVSREMGGKYSRVVKKCLNCYFASGSDLSDRSLQQEYYSDVVEELNGLEESFQELEL